MPKVSIIMGTYNSCKRIDLAIQSIIIQSFKDWEFIICDDGSTDNTFEKILSWQKKDNRIRPIKNEKNLGLATTLNNCLKYCNGEYIARMDDDDISLSSRLEKQVKFLDENQEYAFVSSNIKIFDGEKIQGIKKVPEKPSKKNFLWNSCFVHPATMFRYKDLIKVNGYRVAKETERSQDYDLFMRMYSVGLKGYNIQEPLYLYYINPNEKKKKIKYKYRVNEAIIRYKGFKSLKLFPIGFPFVIKPLIIGLIPLNIIELGKSKFYNKKSNKTSENFLKK